MEKQKENMDKVKNAAQQKYAHRTNSEPEAHINEINCMSRVIPSQ